MQLLLIVSNCVYNSIQLLTDIRFYCYQACSDHFDLVSRRLGFIPLPLGCVVSLLVSFRAFKLGKTHCQSPLTR